MAETEAKANVQEENGKNKFEERKVEREGEGRGDGDAIFSSDVKWRSLSKNQKVEPVSQDEKHVGRTWSFCFMLCKRTKKRSRK